jgi:hypothetical protein
MRAAKSGIDIDCIQLLHVLLCISRSIIFRPRNLVIHHALMNPANLGNAANPTARQFVEALKTNAESHYLFSRSETS